MLENYLYWIGILDIILTREKTEETTRKMLI